jgi:subtilisin family serine protease
MATPIVAGCAALILEQQPSLTPRQLRERLLASALPLGERSDYGEGLVQAP